ncbi:AtpZ/AtpI family protein [Pontibacter mangrovi]|uniref:AtpZ/AtpI family protein n=1 Tax=Pontibacter mangrovi TaxID=2589816 RepID=A0A501WAN1_9BACT|nr:AtpZ/AtpI family protein [Pontibacter mangrovi]TPE45400.1 AtpZ/AtpI family protein [Pontibacter mangrovi]
MEKAPEDKNTPERRRQDNIKPYVKYSGMAFQMIGALVLAAFAGQWLDGKLGNDKPWFTIALLLLAVISTMILTITSINKK